ncbi:MAG: histidine--tRNA ligase [Nitrospirota bacterium]
MEIKAIKGVRDILPEEIPIWQWLEKIVREVFETSGYSEIKIPIIEYTNVFSRSIGETTDIVEKEMYTFLDKSGRSITLRPEGTAPVVRAYVEHKLYSSYLTKLYYIGPMFRYERPQSGRYREFYQIGAEALGVDDPRIDAEIISMLNLLFERLGVAGLKLQINSLGCKECRKDYRDILIKFLSERLSLLCDDCNRRYQKNPLRTLDCKSEGCISATIDAPRMLDYLCKGCRDHFDAVKEYLNMLDIPFTINPRIVRGLDYYTKTAFEILNDKLGAQNAVAAGGRYDGLVEDFGGPPTPGIGFGIGVERLVSLLQKDSTNSHPPEVFIASIGDAAAKLSLPMICRLRYEGVRAELGYKGSLKSQMRKADKSGAKYTIIIGDEEIARKKAILRNMETKVQQEIALDDIIDIIKGLC